MTPPNLVQGHVATLAPVVLPHSPRPFACLSASCRRRFRNLPAAHQHWQNDHRAEFENVLLRVRTLARAGGTDRQIAAILGTTPRRVTTYRLRAGLVRPTNWYASIIQEQGRSLAEADKRIILRQLTKEPRRSSDVFEAFNRERNQLLRPRLSYARFYELMRELQSERRARASTIALPEGRTGTWSLPP